MKILSLFDGISCARVALEKVGINITNYYASEIDKDAIKISEKNYPDIHRLGDVKTVLQQYKEYFIPRPIDLLIFGFPCTDLSVAKRDRKGLSGDSSGLFWDAVDILHTVKPKYFICENVNSMSKENKVIIDNILGIKGIMIDAALVSAQSRKRIFWTNIPDVTLPEDRGIMLKNILLPETYTEFDKSYPLTASYNGAVLWNSIAKNQRTMVWTKPIQVAKFGKGGLAQRIYSIDGKSVTLKANGGGMGAKTGLYHIKDYARKLEPIECERLTGLSDNYTEGVSRVARRKVCGNAFHVDVIKHILSFIPAEDIR